jgi:aspartate/methionine/tyrosine aminotransferase
MTQSLPPLFPPRGVDVTPFYAGQVGRRAAELRALGREIIPMHFGQPTAGTPPGVRAAAARALELDPIGYVESRDLTRRLSRHYRDRYGVDVPPERIQLTAGASAGLVATFAALFHPGDRIVLGRPGYPAYRNALHALGREAVEIPLSARDGYHFAPEALDAVEGPVHGLVVASPANPTGAMLDRKALEALVRRCRERRVQLISDEIYHGVTYGTPAVSALEIDPDALVINSFSKLYRMPGWRLGWIVVPEALVERMSSYVINFFLTPSTIAQFAALAAFDDPAELEARVADYRVNRDLLIRALAATGLPPVAAPDGAFYLYIDVSTLTDDSLAFCLKLLEETGIATAPGIDFDPVTGRGAVRLSFAVSPAEAARAAALLGPWLAAQPRRPA